jgi:hypothetical protein
LGDKVLDAGDARMFRIPTGNGRRMNENDALTKQWCEKVAALAVDRLLDAGLVRRDDLVGATAIVAEEVFVRLCLEDYPPRSPRDRPPVTSG